MGNDQMNGKTGTIVLNRRLRRVAAARRRQSGLTLIETAAALGIVALMLASFGRLTAENQGAVKSRATAIQTAQVTQAATQYIHANYSDVLAATQNGTQKVVIYSGKAPGQGSDPLGTANLPSLQGRGFLTTSYSDRNPYGQRTALIVSQPPDATTGSPSGRLEGMIVTYGGQKIPDSELGRIATSVGASGGFVADKPPTGYASTDIMGAYGGWKAPVSDWTVGSVAPSVGHLASTLAFQVGVGQSDYLNRFNQNDGGEANRMHTDLHLGGNNIDEATNVTASGEVRSNTARADSSVTTPVVQGTGSDFMTVDLNQGSVVNVKTITGALQDVGGVQSQLVNITTDTNVQGSVNVTRDQSVGGDVTVGRDVVSYGKVVGKRFVDADDLKYQTDPNGLNSMNALNPNIINADTVIYGASVNRGVSATDPKTLSLTCSAGDDACQQQVDNAAATYIAEVNQYADGSKAPTMRLGDLLPSMVARGVFVVDSSGNVTDGQVPAHNITWTTSSGATYSSTSLPGIIVGPACGPGGVPEIYLSKLDDSNSFTLSGINPGSSAPPITIAKNSVYSTGSDDEGRAVQVQSTGQVVTDVNLGAGVNLASTVTMAATAVGGNTAWQVTVSQLGEYRSGTNGATTTVPRRVLAQTFCNYNNRRGAYASN